MNKVAFVNNCDDWSWGLVVNNLVVNLSKYFNIKQYNSPMNTPIKTSIFENNNVVITQNVDHLRNIDEKWLPKVIGRIGGMFIGDGNSKNRFDDLFKECGAVIATNYELLNIARQCNNESFIIPNGLDLDVFKPAETPTEREKFTVGFSGNITGLGLHYKGFKIFGEAVTSMYGEIETKKLFYRDNQIPYNRMVPDFYHQIDCLISLSVAEGCSNTIKEALACGVPVITTKVGFHGEMLKDGLDCLFVERDSVDVASAIRKLMNNIDLQTRLSLNGRGFAEKYHNINVVAALYKKVITETINRRYENGR